MWYVVHGIFNILYSIAQNPFVRDHYSIININDSSVAIVKVRDFFSDEYFNLSDVDCCFISFICFEMQIYLPFVICEYPLVMW